MRRGTDGKMKTHDPASPTACCCVLPCTNCSDPPPSAFTVTITGWSACTCKTQGGGVTSYVVTSGDLNGTYTMSPSPSANCLWTCSTDVIVSFYSGATCTGSLLRTETVSMTLGKTGASTWQFQASSTSGVLGIGVASMVRSGICQDTWTSAVGTVGCGAGNNTFGTGGSADFTYVP